MSDSQTLDGPPRRKTELRCFLFLAVFLAPALSVAIVGGLGFSIWIYQMFAGPPGPPM
ncbi:MULTISPECIES: periplasmic nitrate reductase, NapE protein [Thalassospira]|uniref:Periplasmic nitrate reductase, NapE protein n=1 Tax=Thalassospira lucentensis TaxID=168935 RepID=A0A358HQ83_9PROT|nr:MULTISPECIES: periplasmic nitrate reductase, NapE protein [Thalassospira]HBU97359.1 periplasmic nitrate reductase, NapE protein [Thalassospira lucentensis]HCW67660.1 periplasmic nitrate reductase, NapE protein [Thalassospira lucentensis]